MRLKLIGSGVVALIVVGALGARAQSIDPSSVSATMAVGDVLTIHKTITLSSSGANLVDLFFLADATGSMGSTIASAKAGAASILGGVPGTATYKFGAGSYQGDCSEGGLPAGCRVEATTYYGYKEDAPLAAGTAGVTAGINSWAALYGGDTPEAGFDALKDVAELTSWTTGSQRLIVWFGDAPSHTESTTMAGAISALNAEGIKVLAFNNTSGGGGLDGSYGTDFNQASTIAAATGGSLLNNFLSLTGTDFVNAINAAISSATSTLDLNFGTSYGGGGLSFEFVCTDPLGCDGVGGGESRMFDLNITALAEGTYDFSVFASGVDASELDHIVVGGGTSTVPEPSTLMLLGTGLVGLASRRRKRTA